ncbi:MAG: hypothetical protein LKH74_10705 [Levilactobacillus sp.]|jgi:hypothetical protein|uniref:hypothetical protein n=1 Tax=Levilactobacillus sp. TaxID=2767919 RepID=UPI00258E5077|nr:hypothetical protein [Levilactobacillus sp.]MCI1554378.1 hypothetical protein [Levilactobacillus sp.]MCI1598291.1 hypothetical protein [Levilactobacillus sp.]MCI1605338.1 hypothetical protein [Levilactobacillus sp.]
MQFQRLLKEQVLQTADLLVVFLCLLVPVFLVKGVVDLITLGELFWVDYGVFFVATVGGFILLFAVIDLIEVAWQYWHRSN